MAPVTAGGAEEQETPETLRISQRSEKPSPASNCSGYLRVSRSCFSGNQHYFLVFNRRRRSRSRSRSGSLIARLVPAQRCQRIGECSTATKAVAEIAGGDGRSVRGITWFDQTRNFYVLKSR